MSTTRRSVSVSAETYAKIAEYSRTHDIPMSQLTEQLIQAMIGGQVPIAPGVPSTLLAVESRERRGQISRQSERTRSSMERAQRRAALRAKLRLERDLALLARPDVIRARASGKPPPPPTQFPSGAFCGVCAEDCVGQLYQEPIGRMGAMVNICDRCQKEGH